MTDHESNYQPDAETLAETDDETHHDPGSQRPGERIGPYRLLQMVGEGGMGEVWLADQQEPIRRRVALKIIKQGMDTREVVARFESERQVLALLDHPNIAKVLDAGATDRGRPYFVMEYVEGESITDYCDKNRLTTQQRLELFFQVCEGIQHAHRNAIIHRDIKPSNVMVTMLHSKPVPKIIDFGVAKATDQRFTERTLFTELGQLIGTPEYMSPEQAEMTGLGVDTRTDVYSLGVLLYQLLVGVLPFDGRELRRAGFDEIRRRIREVEPARPSTRLSTLVGDLPTLAKARGTSPAKLSHQLRGDLDWIVMKALEKDRTRRYETAIDLAADLRRYLANEPVTATPPSSLYRIRKFVRRHTIGVSFAAVVVGLVSVLAVTMTIQAGRIAKERDRANRQAELAAEEAETARQVSGFLVDLFEVSEPSRAKGNSVTAREILDQGAERIQNELAGQPAVQATMMRTIGQVYTKLGLYTEAQPLVERALALIENQDEPDELSLAESLTVLSELANWQGNYVEGEAAARRAVALREQNQGPDHPDVATALNALGNMLANQGRTEESRETHARALAIRESAPGVPTDAIAGSVHNLAIANYLLEDYDQAEELFKRSAEMERQENGTENAGYATSLHVLAMLYEDQSRLDEALAMEQESMAIRERVLGGDHLHLAYSLCTLGNIHRAQGNAAAAVQPQRRAVAIAEASVGLEHEETFWMRHHLGLSLLEVGEYVAAEALFTQSMQLYEELNDSEGLIYELDAVANAQHRQNQLAEADITYRRSRGLARDQGLAIDTDRLAALRDHVAVVRKLGRDDEADALAAEADSLAAVLDSQ